MFFAVQAQKTVKIQFYSESTGDYDLMIKKVLEQNGYHAFVDYGNNNRLSDFILKYYTRSRELYDELHSFRLELFDSKENLKNKIDKDISYFNLGINEQKEICKGLGKLFDASFLTDSFKKEKEVKYFNIAFNMHKIDSATYSIIAKGAAVRSLDGVKKAALNKASQYLTTFDYYMKDEVYTYGAGYSGFKVYGIIRPASLADEIKQLTITPEEFTNEFGIETF